MIRAWLGHIWLNIAITLIELDRPILDETTFLLLLHLFTMPLAKIAITLTTRYS